MRKINLSAKTLKILGFWPVLVVFFAAIMTVAIAINPSATMAHIVCFGEKSRLEIGFFYSTLLTSALIFYVSLVLHMLLEPEEAKNYFFIAAAPCAVFALLGFVLIPSVTFAGAFIPFLVSWGIAGLFFLLSRVVSINTETPVAA